MGILLITQPILGHLQFSKLSKIQPTKTAALEGYFEEEDGFQMYLFGKVDIENQSTKGIKAPKIIKDNLLGDQSDVAPLNKTKTEFWPPVKRVFNSFHIMIIAWVFIVILFIGLIINYIRKENIKQSYVLIMFIIFTLTVIASLAGWTVSETGRQPWIFFGEINIKNAYLSVQSNFTFWSIMFGNIILPSLLLGIEILLHKHLILNFIKLEKQNTNQ